MRRSIVECASAPVLGQTEKMHQINVKIHWKWRLKQPEGVQVDDGPSTVHYTVNGPIPGLARKARSDINIIFHNHSYHQCKCGPINIKCGVRPGLWVIKMVIDPGQGSLVMVIRPIWVLDPLLHSNEHFVDFFRCDSISRDQLEVC